MLQHVAGAAFDVYGKQMLMNRVSVLDSFGSRSSFLQKRISRVAAFVVLSALLHGDFWEQGHPRQAVKIFAGVTYGCERLAVTQ